MSNCICRKWRWMLRHPILTLRGYHQCHRCMAEYVPPSIFHCCDGDHPAYDEVAPAPHDTTA
jgi:hypothetical protein